MITLNDFQLSPRQIQIYLDKIRDASGRVPYGRDILRRAIDNFSVLPPNFVYSNLTFTQRHLVSKCQEAHLFLSHRVSDEVYWVQQHETVRMRFTAMLSVRETYEMDSKELATWCDEVFVYLKKFCSRTTKHKETTIPQRQLCVDAVYRLVEVARDFDDKGRVLDYYDYLIKLCQRTFVSPTNFVIPFPTLSDRAANEAGASAVVCHGYHDGKEVAVKSFRLYFSSMKRIQKKFLKEAFILRILRHPNVVPFFGTVQEPHRLCIVLPWMKNGNIVEFIRTNPQVSPKELLEQVADGLHFMYEYRVVHGDLKGANVLISDEGKACISDFGISSLQEHVQYLTPKAELDPVEQKRLLQHCRKALQQGGRSPSMAASLTSYMSSFSGAGTFRWMAPERFAEQDTRASFPSDVFSFAMLAIEVYTGLPPHYGITQEMACLRTIAGIRPPQPPSMPDAVWTLTEECWMVEPERRPMILTVYSRLACIP